MDLFKPSLRGEVMVFVLHGEGRGRGGRFSLL